MFVLPPTVRLDNAYSSLILSTDSCTERILTVPIVLTVPLKRSTVHSYSFNPKPDNRDLPFFSQPDIHTKPTSLSTLHYVCIFHIVHEFHPITFLPFILYILTHMLFGIATSHVSFFQICLCALCHSDGEETRQSKKKRRKTTPKDY